MEGKVVERFKRVMLSFFTMALVVGLFVGAGIEAKAEETNAGDTIERWVELKFSGSHMKNGNFDSGYKTSVDVETISSEEIREMVHGSFPSTCNIVGIYEDVECQNSISGNYTTGRSVDVPRNVYVVLHCPHALKNIPTVSNVLLTGASYDSESKKLTATFTFNYANMDGQWMFDFIVNNCSNYFMWAWHAKGSGTASATVEFTLQDENVPFVIVSGGMYNSEDRNTIYPMNMESITIDPKDPTANVVAWPSVSSSGKKDKNNDNNEKRVTQTPENNYAVFQESVKTSVDTAIAQATKAAQQVSSTGTTAELKPIAIDTGVWISFKGDVYQKLQTSGLPVQITFSYMGVRYRVDIPAGADLMSLVDENGYCGFLNLMAHFGGTKL